MKTADDLITDFQELTHEQRKKVIQYVISVKEQEQSDFFSKAFEAEYVEEENYSPETIAYLDRIQEEAEQGIHVEVFSSMKEAIQSLGLSEEDLK